MSRVNWGMLPLYLACQLGTVVAIDPAHAVNITVYHVNQATFGAAPVNMDTGDARGDMFFDMRSMDLPIECAHPNNHTSHDCDNAEVVGNDLAITKLILEVDSSRYGEYGRCNVCVNGSDHHGNNSCTDGVYSCSCGGFYDPVPCNSSVGKASIIDMFSQGIHHYPIGACSDMLSCYQMNVLIKTGGFWFSTTESGWCDAPNADQKTCTWRVAEAVKRVNKTCSDNQLYSTLEAYDNAPSKACFKSCKGQGVHRNTSETCWINCAYQAFLGPNAATNKSKVTDGIDIDVFEKAGWDSPFVSDDVTKGGCPALPIPDIHVRARPAGAFIKVFAS